MADPLEEGFVEVAAADPVDEELVEVTLPLHINEIQVDEEYEYIEVTPPAHTWTWDEVNKNNMTISPRFNGTKTAHMALPSNLTFKSPAMPNFRVFITLALNEIASWIGKGSFFHTIDLDCPHGHLFFFNKIWTVDEREAYRVKSQSERFEALNIKNVHRDEILIPISLWPLTATGPLFKTPFEDPKISSKFAVQTEASFLLKYDSFKKCPQLCSKPSKCHHPATFRPHVFPLQRVQKHFPVVEDVNTVRPYTRTHLQTPTSKTVESHYTYRVVSHSALIGLFIDNWNHFSQSLKAQPTHWEHGSEKSYLETAILPPSDFDWKPDLMVVGKTRTTHSNW